MNHTDFYARIRAIKEMEYRELYAAIELHGASYELNGTAMMGNAPSLLSIQAAYNRLRLMC